ncbi:transcriptional regulator [Roseobacter sp. MED193]|uniref:BTAD domain-containing putative transcriptional regulator n=1 Tax=Roseobacter sp. MED193 TaxID=314262 RepID=UPI000068E3F0|nr:BTAD domain-containing putative transcriptional regulator [Roseobacter sp. MED193]EAQ43654.1 transcriptional regulator [Roseobacter sp. MED193]
MTRSASRDSTGSDPAQTTDIAVNASLIYQETDVGFLVEALVALSQKDSPVLVLSDDDSFLPDLQNQERLDYTAAGLDEIPIRFDVVRERISKAAAPLAMGARIVVDMRWGLQTVSASANFERWGGQCDRLVADLGLSVVSVYARSLLIEDQLIAALRGHSHFLAPSGIYPNPYWLPPEYLEGATLTKQVAFLLGRLVPDYAGLVAGTELGEGAATGADPNWITTPRRIRPRAGGDDVWKIRCFGRLRIYQSDGSQVRWGIPGSAPKKSKALFAYLLQRGERGARADQLAELLWGDEPDETVKRSRLHHAVAMLRKTLGGREFVLRTGEYYSLLPPTGTWIDVSSFEQLCHRAKVLANTGRADEAITLLDAADRLYTGELFEDLLPDFVENDIEDWVMPRRMWFKDMALKVQRDKAEILRRQGHLREALECCQKALNMDPTCEIAHAEAMQIFCAQNRPEAITRQYRQMRAAIEAIGAEFATPELDELQAKLLKSAKNQ